MNYIRIDTLQFTPSTPLQKIYGSLTPFLFSSGWVLALEPVLPFQLISQSNSILSLLPVSVNFQSSS